VSDAMNQGPASLPEWSRWRFESRRPYERQEKKYMDKKRKKKKHPTSEYQNQGKGRLRWASASS